MVVSHNQKELLPRCLDSILGQKLDVPYEIIVSDDRSTDGTWDVIEQYVRHYPDIVKGIHCNSDECNPDNKSDRCGWNKATAYKHCCGEFFVNIDADDYLSGDDIYQLQIDQLRAHPECSMCQQLAWQLDDGKPHDTGFAWPESPWFTTGRVMNVDGVLKKDLLGVNTTYMIRRCGDENPAEKYGKYFNDTVITLYHMQFGPVVMLERAGYVWMQYNTSISNATYGKEGDVFYGMLSLQLASLLPQLRMSLLGRRDLRLYHLLQHCIKGKVMISDNLRDRYKHFDGFLFKYLLSDQRSLKGKVRILKALLIYNRCSRDNFNNKKHVRQLAEALI